MGQIPTFLPLITLTLKARVFDQWEDFLFKGLLRLSLQPGKFLLLIRLSGAQPHQ